MQTLPPRQRAVLLLKDVFEWSSKQIAETLRMSPAAVNSAPCKRPERRWIVRNIVLKNIA
ncbi:sigma factor-like helix-turn-helix DNA-binding protein [Metabacillus sp. RGM 3146]|uniref:sigma factor-like helix-turn-helix DNA-binding protein n=1 Tax=Metabacillus sp. RGM 3146 TaxID=3401092 RepID=UPI003B9BEBD9